MSRDLERERRAIPDVIGATPAPGVGLVDQLEHDLPHVVRVVGHDQPQPGHDHRLALGPADHMLFPDFLGQCATHGVRRLLACHSPECGVCISHIETAISCYGQL